LEDNTCVYIVWAVEKQYEDVRWIQILEDGMQ
jgi:hypothetical protein